MEPHTQQLRALKSSEVLTGLPGSDPQLRILQNKFHVTQKPHTALSTVWHSKWLLSFGAFYNKVRGEAPVLTAAQLGKALEHQSSSDAKVLGARLGLLWPISG